MIAFAQRSIALAIGLIGFASLLGMSLFPKWWALAGVMAVWILFITIGWRILYVWQRISSDVLFVMWAAVFASTGLFFVVDWQLLRWIIMIGTGVLSAMLFGWSISSSGYTTHIEKSYRRILMMLSVLNAYALLTTIFALHIFFQEISFWVFGVVASIVVGVITFLIWRLYYPITIKRHWFWVLLVMLIVFELCWTSQVLPLGYTVLSLFVTWVWYLIQLFFRFQFSEAGVNWDKQRNFLIANVVLFFVVLYLVRWI